MSTKDSNYLTVQNLRYLTNDAMEVTFKVPENLKNEYKFIPGQYLTLEKSYLISMREGHIQFLQIL